MHSQFVSNVELYNNSTKNASGRDSSLPSRLVLDGIADAKLLHFFENAKEAKENSSKVVDFNGEPLVVYHITSEAFNTFNTDKARQYADIPALFFSTGTTDWADMGSRVIPAFLNARNITEKPIVNMNGADILAKLKEQGYDGTILTDTDSEETEYAVFSPNQIKSATNNNGSFDESSDDIRFSIASEENERKEQVQQLATDGIIDKFSDIGLEPILISDEEAEQIFGLQNSGVEFDKSHKSSIFVPASKIPQKDRERELTVARQALFAKVQDHAKAGTTYGVFSANYFHIFDGNRHIGAIKIEGNEDTIDYIQKGISNGTYRNTKSIGQWLRAISSGKRYDNRDNANAPRQRGGDVAANALYGGQPTDSQRNQYQSNGDSGNTVPLRTSSGVVFGFVRNGKIYITAHGLNPNTPIHEYTHLWAKALQQKNRKAWQSIVDLLKDTPMWNDVVNDPNYADLQGNDDAIASEVLARYSGKHGAERFEQEAKRVLQNKSIKDYARTRVLIDNVREALNRFWNWVGKDLFHIDHFDSIDEVADRVKIDPYTLTYTTKGCLSTALCFIQTLPFGASTLLWELGSDTCHERHSFSSSPQS